MMTSRVGGFTVLQDIVYQRIALRLFFCVKGQKDKAQRVVFVRFYHMRFTWERKETIVFTNVNGRIVYVGNALSANNVRDFKILLLVLRNDGIFCAKRFARLKQEEISAAFWVDK
jgi:hypothetical protein